MAAECEALEAIAIDLYADETLDEVELAAVLECLEDKAPVFPYWSYDRFNLEEMMVDECLSEFRFAKADIPRLASALQLPEKFICPNGTVAKKIEGLCILLKRLAYPCRYSDLIPRFGRSKSELCLIVATVMRCISTNHGYLLETFEQPWLHPSKLEEYAQAVYRKSNALKNCWGFIDGTVRQICRPEKYQRTVYNGHKRVHALKYQSIVAANGLIANLYGPIEGRRHDAALLRMSNVLSMLELHCNAEDGSPLCIYGDPAYPLRDHLMTAHRNNNLSEAEEEFNKSMSSVRVTVEWVFGEIVGYLAFTDFKKNQKLGLSAVGTTYITSALLRNALTCLYGSSTSTFLGLSPPSLEEDFQTP